MNHIIAVDEAILFYTASLLEGKVAKYTRGADAPRPAPPPRSPCPTVPNPPSPRAVLRLCGGVGGVRGALPPAVSVYFATPPIRKTPSVPVMNEEFPACDARTRRNLLFDSEERCGRRDVKPQNQSKCWETQFHKENPESPKGDPV